MYKYIPELTLTAEGRMIDAAGTPDYPIYSFEGNLRDIAVIWHWHSELELLTVRSGAISVSGGSATLAVPEGGGCFINAGVLHSARRTDPSPEADGAYHSIVFHPRLIGGRDSVFWKKYLQPLEESSFPQMVPLLPDRDAPLLALIEQTWEVDASGAPGHENESRYLLTKILGHLSGRGTARDAHVPSERERRDMERAKVMLEYLETHFDGEVTVEAVADSAAVSKSECLRCFRRMTGTTPIQFLKDFRIRRAAEMMRETELKISEIAGLCGFTDVSYFTKTFRGIFDCTPTEYRERQDGRRRRHSPRRDGNLSGFVLP